MNSTPLPTLCGGLSERRTAHALGASMNLEQMLELGRAGKLDANDRYVVNIVDWLLQYAFDQRASDIHLEPRRDNSDVRFRIDGVLHPVYQLPTVVMSAVISRLKVLGRMDLAEKRRPQDGRIKTRGPTGGEIELRLSTMPSVFGEKLVMRIFDPEVTVRSFEELGFSERELGQWKKMVSSPLWYYSRYRADRVRQDDHTLLNLEIPCQTGSKRLHGRRPDRDG